MIVSSTTSSVACFPALINHSWKGVEVSKESPAKLNDLVSLFIAEVVVMVSCNIAFKPHFLSPCSHLRSDSAIASKLFEAFIEAPGFIHALSRNIQDLSTKHHCHIGMPSASVIKCFEKSFLDLFRHVVGDFNANSFRVHGVHEKVVTLIEVKDSIVIELSWIVVLRVNLSSNHLFTMSAAQWNPEVTVTHFGVGTTAECGFLSAAVRTVDLGYEKRHRLLPSLFSICSDVRLIDALYMGDQT